MLLAIEAMDPVLQGILFLVAVILFVLAAVNVGWGKVNLIAAGLAFFAFVFCWQAFASA